MEFTEQQKQYLVPASIGAAVFVLCDELVFRPLGAPTNVRNPQTTRKSLLAAGASALAGYFLYDKAAADTKADLAKYSLPAGGAAAAFAAVNRFSEPLWSSKKTDRRPYALGAAAVAAWLVNKPPSSPTVGMLPERTFEPPYPPPFGPPFESEFTG